MKKMRTLAVLAGVLGFGIGMMALPSTAEAHGRLRHRRGVHVRVGVSPYVGVHYARPARPYAYAYSDPYYYDDYGSDYAYDYDSAYDPYYYDDYYPAYGVRVWENRAPNYYVGFGGRHHRHGRVYQRNWGHGGQRAYRGGGHRSGGWGRGDRGVRGGGGRGDRGDRGRGGRAVHRGRR
jgi:hypothetical protein